MAESRDAEALFRLPLDEFTSARNALAERLKKAGDPEAAARVKALAKPPLSAWVVNQLYWRHREAFDRLIAAGARLRRAQASQLRGKGGDLREPLDARRTATSELTRLAMRVAREVGHAAGPDLLRRITATLDALATYAGDPSGPAAGRLTADVDAPGFEALSALIPAAGASARRSSSHVLPFRQKRSVPASRPEPAADARQRKAAQRAERAAAAAAVRAAERDLMAARKAAARAEADLKAAAVRVRQAERTKVRLAAQMDDAATETDRAREQARQVAAAAENAAQAVADAERLLAEAKRRRVRGN